MWKRQGSRACGRTINRKPARPYRVELLLCGHHSRLSQWILAAVCAVARVIQGRSAGPVAVAAVCVVVQLAAACVGSVISNLDTAPGSPYRRGEKVVALTFDDGPSPVYTPQILRILAAARAPASFEIIGVDGAAYLGILRAENAAGMVLMNHTWAHVDLALLPAGSWPTQVDRTSSLLRGITGHPVRCLRPPYGLTDPQVQAQLRIRGLAELGWDVDPSDYLRLDAAVIARRVLAALHPGAIVILHDGGGNRSQTVAALPTIISGIRAAEYQIVPVCAG
jgi:peptidoglycan-N-acetylglucosamine deacetylase